MSKAWFSALRLVLESHADFLYEDIDRLSKKYLKSSKLAFLKRQNLSILSSMKSEIRKTLIQKNRCAGGVTGESESEGWFFLAESWLAESLKHGKDVIVDGQLVKRRSTLDARLSNFFLPATRNPLLLFV